MQSDEDKARSDYRLSGFGLARYAKRTGLDMPDAARSLEQNGLLDAGDAMARTARGIDKSEAMRARVEAAKTPEGLAEFVLTQTESFRRDDLGSKDAKAAVNGLRKAAHEKKLGPTATADRMETLSAELAENGRHDDALACRQVAGVAGQAGVEVARERDARDKADQSRSDFSASGSSIAKYAKRTNMDMADAARDLEQTGLVSRDDPTLRMAKAIDGSEAMRERVDLAKSPRGLGFFVISQTDGFSSADPELAGLRKAARQEKIGPTAVAQSMEAISKRLAADGKSNEALACRQVFGVAGQAGAELARERQAPARSTRDAGKALEM